MSLNLETNLFGRLEVAKLEAIEALVEVERVGVHFEYRVQGPFQQRLSQANSQSAFLQPKRSFEHLKRPIVGPFPIVYRKSSDWYNRVWSRSD